MRLHGPQSRLELAVARPDLDGWCKIRLTIDGPDGSWDAESRCLLAAEVVRLADWLESAANTPGSPGRFDTLDNDLSFELLGGLTPSLRVYLEWQLRPIWAREVACGEFYRDFPVSERVLRQAAASLREQLQQATKGSRT